VEDSKLARDVEDSKLARDVEDSKLARDVEDSKLAKLKTRAKQKSHSLHHFSLLESERVDTNEPFTTSLVLESERVDTNELLTTSLVARVYSSLKESTRTSS
jgi:hypothetical protein